MLVLSPPATSNSPGLFSTSDFVDAVSRVFPRYEPVSIQAPTGGGPRTLYGISQKQSFGRRALLFGPFGLPAAPDGATDELAQLTRQILQGACTLSTTHLIWNVAFDSEALASCLRGFGLAEETSSTHVITLSRGYSDVFSRYNPTIRNHVRRSKRSPVSVRRVTDQKTIRAYFEVHEKLAKSKGNYRSLYPLDLFLSLARLENMLFVVAELEGKVIAGGVFFRDGNSLFYWHGASDRAYSSEHAAAAVLDYAIQHACSLGMETFNMGASNGIESLEQFKTFWGAEKYPYWHFTWCNPHHTLFTHLKTVLQKFPYLQLRRSFSPTVSRHKVPTT